MVCLDEGKLRASTYSSHGYKKSRNTNVRQYINEGKKTNLIYFVYQPTST